MFFLSNVFKKNTKHEMKKFKKRLLMLNCMKFPVYIGVCETEFLEKQIVVINIDFGFRRKTKGIMNDELKNVLCYKQIYDFLLSLVLKKHYRLIEHLSYILIESIVYWLNISIRIKLSIEKKLQLKKLGSAIFKVEKNV